MSTSVPRWSGGKVAGGGGATARARGVSKDTETGTAGAGIDVALRGVAADVATKQESRLGDEAWASVPGTGRTVVVEMMGCSTVRKLVRCSAPTVTFSGEESVA